MSMPFSQLVGVQGSTARAYGRADCRAFLSTAESAYAGARRSRSRHRKFVPMLLPKRTAVTTMTAYRLRGRNRHRSKSQYQHY
jgi:hypothetical protein